MTYERAERRGEKELNRGGSGEMVDFVRKMTFSARNAIWNGLFFHLFGVIGSLLWPLCGSHPSKNLFDLK